MLYWNRCVIKDIETDPKIPGSEEYFNVDFLDFKPHFNFKVYARSCNKFEDASGCFDYKRFKPGTEIVVRLAGELHMYRALKLEKVDKNKHWEEGFVTMINSNGDKNYFLRGYVIGRNPEDYGREGRVMKANNLYVYFTDINNKTKKGDNVLISLTGILDLKE
ncbi:MAG: hypothetical protein JSW00_15765 [Thermoplasmata archaeon]|nr:MAG: hypothetical protein JSW00_15765 [Thermoplasmata archaeon]